MAQKYRKRDNYLPKMAHGEEIMMNRRAFFHSAAATAIGTLAATSALAQSKADPPGTTPPPRDWNQTVELYPDPAFEAFDPRFNKYNANTFK
jgi:hypothetical protein